MHLKRIDILGFKSFANKTTIDFANGVTSIVGPNGCGKTNILDALRWVLGEQKPTFLRGSKMEEVIFNGTRDMKPLGMAEVTLTIINDHGILPTEYHELQITRRLFRSGESEYLINKVPCRLKDITDMFANTGVGAHSYSVIQQHMIDSVISDKAEERRFLFEEAAGITKYKQRRKAALRKLEATENDFLRLKDVYAEVKTRVNSLYRQHKKAERYKKLADEIKAWEVYLGATRLRRVENERRELRAQTESLSDQKSGRQTALDQAYARLESDRKELVEIEHQLTELGTELMSVSDEAHEIERQISVLREKKANAGTLIERNRVDIKGLEARTATIENQLKEAHEELERQRQELEESNVRLKDAQTEHAAADQQLLAARMAREDKSQKLLHLEGRLSSGKTEESNLRRQQTEFSESITAIEKEIEQNLPRQKTLLEQIEKLRGELAEQTAARTNKEKRLNEAVAEMDRRLESGEELALEISNVTASIEACEARRRLLEEMMLQYEGHESGVVAAMEVKERWPAVAGTVADKFVPVEGMETVLEAALGEIARFLICYDRPTAESVIDYLKTEGKGRTGILVPHSGTITPAVKRPPMEMPGVIGWLDSYVSTDENLRPLMEAVLSRTLVFEAGSAPDAILEHLPYGFAAVSTDGVLYGKNVISGGSDDRFPLFRRKEKLAEQEALREKLNDKLEEVQLQKNRNTAQIGALRAESGELNSAIESIDEELTETRNKLSECEFEQRSMTAEFQRFNREKQSFQERLEQIRHQQYTLGLDFNELALQKETLVANMNQAGNQLENLEQTATAAAENVSRLQVAAIEARSRLEQTESRINHIKEIDQEIRHSREAGLAEIEQAEKDINNAEETTATLESRLKECFERRDGKSSRQEELREVQSQLAERTTVQENQTKDLRQQKDTVAEQLHQAEIRLTTIESETNALTDKMRDEYEIDIANVEIVCPDENVTPEQAVELLASNKEKLRSFGAVNLLALEEYEVAAEREKFLNEQLADLTTAKNELKSTITRINQTARQLFNETFEKVRKNFQKLFVELFNGGEADISLVDPDDPLESHIDITARPGGKKLLPITILSGGERALTAISLLFSLYLVKPSPFCILDEIDAPLDDANCHRFLTIIRNFSSQTQFITITHNKITMQASNNLYGVTMEQAGVSKLVAVRFSDSGNGDLVEIKEELPESIRERLSSDVTVGPNEEQ